MSIDPGALVPKHKQLCHMTSRRQGVRRDTSHKANININHEDETIDIR